MPNTYSGREPFADPASEPNSDSEAFTHSNAGTDPYTDAKTDSEPDAYAHTNSSSKPKPKSCSRNLQPSQLYVAVGSALYFAHRLLS